jgi:hypothetical protein
MCITMICMSQACGIELLLRPIILFELVECTRLSPFFTGPMGHARTGDSTVCARMF